MSNKIRNASGNVIGGFNKWHSFMDTVYRFAVWVKRVAIASIILFIILFIFVFISTLPLWV